MDTPNVAIVHRFELAFGANDVATIDALCSPLLVDHDPVPGQAPGFEGFKATIASYQTAFPDLTIDVHEVIGMADVVATRWTASGTHRGELLGVAVTGKHVSVGGMNFYRLADGKITDVWTQFDALGMLQQLGALPGAQG